MRIGNYKVIKQIGEGGFARTYLAKHIELDEYACLKQNLELSDEDTQLLMREAKLLWHIHHYSLPTLRDLLKCDDGSYVLVMTYIDGANLYDIVNEKYTSGLDAEVVCWITQRLLNALHYLHSHGIIHSDVKPHNIIIKPDEHNAVLVDYGLSTLKPKRDTKGHGYTPAYAAPEQLAGKSPIPETDIYGLGMSMKYALIGNRVSFSDNRLVKFFNKMVVRNPNKRPKSAGDLVSELSDIRLTMFGRRQSDDSLKL